jgi:hypothetical protein
MPREPCRRRVLLAADLIQEGIGTLIIESAYYGSRKPLQQDRSKLKHVADLIKLGAMTIVESLWSIHMLHAAGIRKV